MKLIVGLGNPGADYTGTRHNVGFELIDTLASAHSIKVDDRIRGIRAIVGRGVIQEHPVMLVKPLTYMNASGEAVAALAKLMLTDRLPDDTERIAIENILILCDDIHLPVGKIRLRAQGSSGGQNGLKSVASHLASQAFARIRIGVGEPPPDQQIDWVLGKFGRADRELINDVLITAMGAAEVWTTAGIETAMNRFNTGSK